MVRAEEARRLLQIGRRGQAMVMEMRTTGVTVDENPEAELELCVSLDGEDPYRVTHRQLISRVAINGFQPGVRVPVRVDPCDPHNVLL